jgi:hypothetical protein
MTIIDWDLYYNPSTKEAKLSNLGLKTFFWKFAPKDIEVFW